MTDIETLIRKPDVIRMTGLPASTIYRLIKAGRFPKQVKLAERASAWPLSAIQDFIAARIKAATTEKPE